MEFKILEKTLKNNKIVYQLFVKEWWLIFPYWDIKYYNDNGKVNIYWPDLKIVKEECDRLLNLFKKHKKEINGNKVKSSRIIKIDKIILE